MIRFNQIRFRTGVLLLGVIFLMVAGCSKITPENYQKLNSGMTYEEVQKIIGEPTKCDATMGFKNCVWEQGDKSISVKFMADKVLLFSNRNL